MCISDKKDSCLFCFLKIDDAQDLNAKCIRGTANKDMVHYGLLCTRYPLFKGLTTPSSLKPLCFQNVH